MTLLKDHNFTDAEVRTMTYPKDLELRIKSAATAYYNGQPIMSDEEFDKLVDDLRKVDSSNSLLHTPGWGATFKDNKVLLPKVPMSLNKIKSLNSLRGKNLAVEAKVDGLTTFIWFREGEVIKAATRGDGEYGQDITDKIKTVLSGIKVQGTGKLRVECYVPLIKFADYREEYANPRNMASGIINSKNPGELIDVIHLAILDNIEGTIDFESNLRVEPLPVSTIYVEGVESDNLLKTIYERNAQLYPVDGVVLYEVNEDFTKLSEKIAFKFETESIETEVVKIHYQLSSRGRIIPVIEFNPVQLYGTTVSRATGLHCQWLMDEGVQVGTKIKVTKANEIIPQIVEVIHSDFFLKQVAKEHVSQYLTENFLNKGYRWDGVHIMKDHEDHEELVIKDLMSAFLPKGLTNVDPIYETLVSGDVDRDIKVEQFFHGRINSSEFIQEYSQQFERTPTKKLKEFLDSMHRGAPEKSSITIEQFFTAFRVDGLGWSQASKVAALVPDNAMNRPISKIELVMLLEEAKVNVRVNRNIQNVLDLMVKYWSILTDFDRIRKSMVAHVDTTGKLRACLTGKFEGMTKEEVAQKLINKGIIVEGSVHKDLDFLIVSDKNSTSSKTNKAKSLGVEILTLEEVLNG